MTAPVAIGIGCRRGCPPEAIETLVHQALALLPDAAPLGLFTIVDKRGETGLIEAADRLGLDLVFLPRETLREKAPLVWTRSLGSESRFQVPSVSEASALAGAGRGAMLLVGRIAQNGATCAVARVGGAVA